MHRRPAAECCKRSEQCIEAPAVQFGRFDTIFATQKSLSDCQNRCLSAAPKAQCIEGTGHQHGRFDKKQLKTKNSKLITKSAPGMEAVMRGRRAAGLPWRRGDRRKPRPPRSQGKSGPPAHFSGQPDGGAWRCSKHKTFTPSLVLFADNGIDNPRHSYGYAFGLPALFSTKITSTYPTFYACCNAVRKRGSTRALLRPEAEPVAPPRCAAARRRGPERVRRGAPKIHIFPLYHRRSEGNMRN